MTEEETQKIDLPTEIVSQVENRLHYTNFETTEDYITYVLTEVLHHIETTSDDDNKPVDEEAVHEQLRALGYLGE